MSILTNSLSPHIYSCFFLFSSTASSSDSYVSYAELLEHSLCLLQTSVLFVPKYQYTLSMETFIKLFFWSKYCSLLSITYGKL